MSDSGSPIIRRLEPSTGIPDLVTTLADRLSPTDLQSLLLAVHHRRASRTTPARVLRQYESDRFSAPSPLDPALLSAFDELAFRSLARAGHAGIELSPVCPLGTIAAPTNVDHNKVLTADRGTEVVADATNVLALESAVRRRAQLTEDPKSTQRVRLAASHRLVRAQPIPHGSGFRPHFALLALTTAGRDEGSFRFETDSLVDQLAALLRLVDEATDHGYQFADIRVTVTDLDNGRRTDALQRSVVEQLSRRFGHVDVAFDASRAGGRTYYVNACFQIHATSPAGIRFQISDGGFTTWTQQLLGNAKERLLVGCVAPELICGRFRAGAGGG